jgi:hypothetical protein
MTFLIIIIVIAIYIYARQFFGAKEKSPVSFGTVLGKVIGGILGCIIFIPIILISWGCIL